MEEDHKAAQKEKIMKRILMVVNCIIQVAGTCGAPLVIRLYFIHGGKRIWLSSFLQNAGFPILLLPLSISYIIRRRRRGIDSTKTTKMFSMKLPLFIASAVIGVLQGLDSILYASGLSSLPVSTSVLVIATQLAFTAIFAFFLVRQKFTPFSVNAVVMLILGAGVLALHGSGDRSAGETTKQYAMGFVMTCIAALLFGLILPLVELMYKRTKQIITYSLVVEIQLVVCLFGAIFTIIGMIINNDFKVIPREAKNFELGKTTYYVLLIVDAIVWQLSGLGAMGVVFCASSLLSGIMVAMSTPLTEVLAIIFYKEKFHPLKGISLVLSLWGFISYFYGEFKQIQRMTTDHIPDSEQPQSHSTIANP